MTAECVRCGRPTADGYACVDETRKAAEQLRQIVDMVPAARDVAHGFDRRGASGSGGKPASRLPLDLGATSKLDAVERELGTWARHVAAERGVPLGVTFCAWCVVPEAPDPKAHPGGAASHGGGDDVVAVLAGWLAEHLEWWRHRAEVGEFLTDVAACARVVAGIARGPAPQRYLGPCGAVRMLPDPVDDEFEYEDYPCEGDIYAREGAQNGSCRLCGAQVSTDARRAWLDAEVRSHAYTAAEIAAAYPSIKANTIRQWLSRGLLVGHGELSGRPLLLLGDVLDLAAGDAARRETARNERTRRAAVRAEEASDAA